MNPMIQLKKTTPIFIVVLLLACFGFFPAAKGVSPPPDGGYPNFTTAEGEDALFSLTTGSANTALGFQALFSNTTGSLNTATGHNALGKNTAGSENVAIGVNALLTNTTGDDNVAIGVHALYLSRTATCNTAIGAGALASNTTGNYNAAIGFQSLENNKTGERNTAIGLNSLENNTTGSFNVALGAGAGSGVTTADDVICIGRAVAGANVGGTCFIGNIRGVTTQNGNALPVLIDGDGQLGTASSSRRFKHDIRPMDKASESIFGLKPVTFHYNSDKTATPQFGLIAEEVAEVNADLVVRDEEGEVYTVRYDQVNVMLLNEFLKEHRKNEEQQCSLQEQEALIARQQKQIETLTAAVQKVSAQLEVSNAAPQTVLDNR